MPPHTSRSYPSLSARIGWHTKFPLRRDSAKILETAPVCTDPARGFLQFPHLNFAERNRPVAMVPPPHRRAHGKGWRFPTGQDGLGRYLGDPRTGFAETPHLACPMPAGFAGCLACCRLWSRSQGRGVRRTHAVQPAHLAVNAGGRVGSAADPTVPLGDRTVPGAKIEPHPAAHRDPRPCRQARPWVRCAGRRRHPWACERSGPFPPFPFPA